MSENCRNPTRETPASENILRIGMNDLPNSGAENSEKVLGPPATHWGLFLRASAIDESGESHVFVTYELDSLDKMFAAISSGQGAYKHVYWRMLPRFVDGKFICRVCFADKPPHSDEFNEALLPQNLNAGMNAGMRFVYYYFTSDEPTLIQAWQSLSKQIASATIPEHCIVDWRYMPNVIRVVADTRTYFQGAARFSVEAKESGGVVEAFPCKEYADIVGR